MKRRQALAEYLGENPSAITLVSENLYKFRTDEYLVLRGYEADKLTKFEIENSLWAFKPEFILSFCGIEQEQKLIDALLVMQGKLCEDANLIILAMIGGERKLNEFCKAAIEQDGRGLFLAPYDHKERMYDEYFIYRV